jgi:tRNA pseudouridine55 synthase
MATEPNGVVIVDKVAGLSSAKVVAQVKELFQAKKAGHAGTLDPFATGVLVCCLNRATRLARFLLRGFKKYEAVLQLGMTTDTQDATGKVTSEASCLAVSDQRIRSVFQQFEGAIEQKPPLYSALKHQGVPLYKLARHGHPVQKPARPVFIESLEIQKIVLPEVRFTVACSAGTYVRTLCADIGERLDCGGHLKCLRRTYSSGFTIDEALTIETLAKQTATASVKIIPLGQALRGMPVHIADDTLGHKIRRGVVLDSRDVDMLEADPSQGWVQVLDPALDLLAVIEADRPGNRWRYCCVFD